MRNHALRASIAHGARMVLRATLGQRDLRAIVRHGLQAACWHARQGNFLAATHWLMGSARRAYTDLGYQTGARDAREVLRHA